MKLVSNGNNRPLITQARRSMRYARASGRYQSTSATVLCMSGNLCCSFFLSSHFPRAFRIVLPITAATILTTLWMIFGHCQALSAAERTTAKPDILLIMPDQMRGDCLSTLGHPVVRTPELDRLASEGALFRRTYSTVPSCIPARHAILTG
jgi:hypothetical protein